MIRLAPGITLLCCEPVPVLQEFTRNKGKFKKVEAKYRRALSDLEKAHGPDHKESRNVLEGLRSLKTKNPGYTKDLIKPDFQRRVIDTCPCTTVLLSVFVLLG
jgi:hypothetical protein